ncbi:TPA: DUF4917 family protein [Legionella pneumophila]|nr:DUF4917 family protein [Legionella pneumophila]
MKLLSNALFLLKLYDGVDSGLLNNIQADIAQLKNILVETISKNHPDNPTAISDTQYQSCQIFLSEFQTIYTLNYDLLLYWTVMHNQNEFNDGFEDPHSELALLGQEYYEEKYVKWSMGNETSANILFIHGALHLYDAGIETRKYCWKRTGVSLKEQILMGMDDEMYPLFVAEGSQEEKFTKINHNSYLSRCYRSFQSKSGALFIFGLALKENDSHICEAITDGAFSALFVSLYGDINSSENIEIKEKIQSLVYLREQREKKKEKNSKRYKAKNLSIYTFHADTAKVWG